MFAARLAKARALMETQGVDVMLLSVGADLPYFCGYEAMPLERLTMLVVPRDDHATLVVPRLEVPRVTPRPEVFSLRGWDETQDPVEIVAELMGPATTASIGDHTWARFLVDLMAAKPFTKWRRASRITSPLRSVKEPDEVAMLRAAGQAADRVMAQFRSGEVALVGRTEAEVSADLGRRIIAEGHRRVNFAIVAAGANASSPHHEPGDRVIQPGEVVLADIGGTMSDDHGVGYCSDITRCVYTGEPDADFTAMYDVLFDAQAAAVASAVVGKPAEDVDRAARSIITAHGYGEHFVHRTGHGIGIEEHEDPYIVEGNDHRLQPGNAFSVEPGIYIPGRWGARIEDIVVATEAGPDAMNTTDHHLAVLA